MDDRDNRRFERIADSHYIKFCSEADHANWDIAPIINISAGGILFHAPKYYSPGSIIDIMLYIPFGDPDRINKADVIRCDEIRKGGGVYEVVVGITHFDEETKVALYKIIDFLKKRRGRKK